MPDYQMLTTLLDLPDVRVTHYQLVGRDRRHLFVESTAPAALCPQCHHPSMTVHDTSEPQMIRDLPIWGRRCWLRYAPRRFRCPTCRTSFVERLAWRETGWDYTLRYEQWLSERAVHEPVAQIAQSEHLSEDTVEGIFARWAQKNWHSVAIPA
jgi:transposase